MIIYGIEKNVKATGAASTSMFFTEIEDAVNYAKQKANAAATDEESWAVYIRVEGIHYVPYIHAVCVPGGEMADVELIIRDVELAKSVEDAREIERRRMIELRAAFPWLYKDDEKNAGVV